MQVQGEILQNKMVAKDTWFMVIKSAALAGQSKPGHFVNVRVADSDTPLLRRPMSLHFIDTEQGAIGLLYLVVGTGTARMSRLQVGESIDLIGPLGNGFHLNFPGQRALVVGGGIGMAPLLPLVMALKSAGKDVRVLCGVRDQEYLPDLGTYNRLGVEVQVCSDNGSIGREGFVTGLLEENLTQGGWNYLYACGPKPMLAAVEKLAATYHIAGEISTEERMGCGLGICLSCSCDTTLGAKKKVCVDGPVFRLGELRYE